VRLEIEKTPSPYAPFVCRYAASAFGQNRIRLPKRNEGMIPCFAFRKIVKRDTCSRSANSSGVSAWSAFLIRSMTLISKIFFVCKDFQGV
jgi:hypothetical protein